MLLPLNLHGIKLMSCKTCSSPIDLLDNFCWNCGKMTKLWKIKNFFFKPIFRHPVYVDTDQRNPKLLQRRTDWCNECLGKFSWMSLVEQGISGEFDNYTWNQSLFHFRRKKDAAAFKLTWYNNTAKE